MEKIKRDSFGYMEPRGDNPDFAQCGGNCRDFDRDAGRCAILGPVFKVIAEATCTEYVEGAFEARTLRNLCTPKEVGYVERKVRCENCYFGGAKCGLYKRLNETLPDLFDIDEVIHPKGCCNFNTAKEG